MSTSRRFLTGAGLLALAALAPAPPARAAYTFQSFDNTTNTGGGTFGNGINNNGAVVGFSQDAGMAVFSSYVRNPDGTFTQLALANTAQANGINGANTVVGFNGTNAFSLTGNTVTNLPAADPGNTTSEIAFGINDKGAIVGQYLNTATGQSPGFLFQNNTFTLFTPTAGATATFVQGINNNGLAVGMYNTTAVGVNPPVQHGFLWDTVGKTTTLLADPSIPGGPGQLQLVQFLGVNDHNQAVGYYQTVNGSQHGFLFDIPTKAYTFLDAPLAATINGVSITQITGINNSNYLSGFYVGADGLSHAFLAVPEPGSLALLGIGLGGLFAVRRRAAPTR